jgi:hypothetical protein
MALDTVLQLYIVVAFSKQVLSYGNVFRLMVKNCSQKLLGSTSVIGCLWHRKHVAVNILI